MARQMVDTTPGLPRSLLPPAPRTLGESSVDSGHRNNFNARVPRVVVTQSGKERTTTVSPSEPFDSIAEYNKWIAEVSNK
ncbi:hypothetical protein COOONC_18566 [Cooperia oncophora]